MGRPNTYPHGFALYRENPEVAKLLQYLMLHPGSSRLQIMSGTQCSISEVSRILPRLRSYGILDTVQQKNKKLYSISGLYLPALAADFGGLI